MQLNSTNLREPFAMTTLRVENERLLLLCAAAEKRASDQLILLRESDHRIKNSLQLVASMLVLQARLEKNEQAAETLRAAASRTQSIGHIHEALQGSAGQDVVDLGQVINALCGSLGALTGDVRQIVVHAEPALVPTAIARSIALAVNELILNALRHAFPEDRAGIVEVIIAKSDGGLRVVVADNGDGFNSDSTHGFGTTLIETMAAQLGATLVRENSPGARVTLTVPAHNPLLTVTGAHGAARALNP